MGSRPNTPLLQHSVSLARLASEIFLSSLHTAYFFKNQLSLRTRRGGESSCEYEEESCLEHFRS